MMLGRPRTLAAVLGALAIHATAHGATMPDDMAALLPPGTAGIVYVPSPEALESKLSSLAREVAPEQAGKMAITAMLQGNLGPLAAYWDASRPIAVAAVPAPPGGESVMPAITLLVPITNPKQAMSDLGIDPDTPNPMLTFGGNYAAMTMVPGPGGAAEGTSVLAEADLRGDLTLRLDVGALMTTYGPMARMMTGQMMMGMAAAADSLGTEGEATTAMVSGMAEKLFEVLEAGERADLSVAIDGGEVEIGYEYLAREGSSLDMPHPAPGAVAKVGGMLRSEGSWGTSVFDPSSLTWMYDSMKGKLDDSPESREMMEAIENAHAFYDALDHAAGFWFGLIDGKGIAGAMVAEVRDRDAAEEALGKAMEASMALYSDQSLSIEATGTTTIRGVEVTTHRYTFDVNAFVGETDGEMTEEDRQKMSRFMDAFLGEEDAVLLHSGFVGERLVIGIGSEDEMARTIEHVRSGGGDTPAGIRAVLDRAGVPASFAGSVDLRRVVRDVAVLMAELEDGPEITLADGAPIDFAFWLGHEGRLYRGGMAADAIGIAEIADAFPDEEETAHEATGNGMH